MSGQWGGLLDSKGYGQWQKAQLEGSYQWYNPEVDTKINIV